MGDAGAKTRVEGEEILHAISIAGQDDDQILALIFHHLEKNLDRLLTVIALVIRAVEVIGLIDEQHPAKGFFEDLLGLRRGVADILAHQIVARDGNQLALPDEAQRLEDPRHPHCDGGLAGAGIAGEGHMQRRRFGAEAKTLANPFDQQQRGDFADPRLHRLQTNQILVEADEVRLQPGAGEFGAQVD